MLYIMLLLLQEKYQSLQQLKFEQMAAEKEDCFFERFDASGHLVNWHSFWSSCCSALHI